MTAAGYAVLAYAVGLGLIAGYGVRLWVAGRRSRDPGRGR